MAWRNYDNETKNIVCFNSKGKTKLVDGNSEVLYNSNEEETTVQTFTGPRFICHSKQRFSLKVINIDNPVTVSFCRPIDELPVHPLQTYVINPGEEIHGVIFDNWFDVVTNEWGNTYSYFLIKCENMPYCDWWHGERKYVQFDLYPYYERIPAENFVDKQLGTASSLEQLLSVIKSELWYNKSYGLPLYDKVSSKFQMDAALLTIVNSHSEVRSIKTFLSYLLEHKYHCHLEVESIYGELQIDI